MKQQFTQRNGGEQMNKLKLMTIGFVLFNALVLQESYGGIVIKDREPRCGEKKIYRCGNENTTGNSNRCGCVNVNKSASSGQ